MKKANYFYYNIVLIMLIVIGMGFYLFYVNSSISSSMGLKNKQQEIQKLRSSQEELVKELASLGSISRLYTDVQKSNMVKVTAANYITVPQETFAKR